MKIRGHRGESKVALEMTPMIDVVFQLLIFFMFSFKIVAVEGEFSVNMPKMQGSAAGPTDPTDVLPEVTVQLVPKEGTGELGAIVVNDENSVGSIPELAGLFAALTNNDQAIAEETELKIVAPSALHYEHVMAVINAAAGSNIQKVKFTPPED